MRYFSMFSGIGGFELGIQRADWKWRDEANDCNMLTGHIPKPECIGFSEIDKYAIQIYERHFPFKQCKNCEYKENRKYLQGSERGGVRPTGNQPNPEGGSNEQPESWGDRVEQQSENNCKCEHKNYGNATTIDATKLPDFDLLVGGFPCQAFSIAGKRGGLADTRGTLFYDIARIAKEKRPQHLLLENVKGLLSHDNGRTFKLIISTFAELGYDLEWQVLNSKNFGVPQNRERVFIIGHLGACCGRQVFPLGAADQKTPELSGPVSNTLTTRYEGGTAVGTYVAESELNAQEVSRQPLKFLERNGKHTDGEYSFTVDTANTGGVKVNSRIRRLTPTECERLQAYPDGWTEGVSDTQRYKTLGNGVTVNVVQHIIQKLIT
jgi:DNA (cytosine-5)-methyltransferase 1